MHLVLISRGREEAPEALLRSCLVWNTTLQPLSWDQHQQRGEWQRTSIDWGQLPRERWSRGSWRGGDKLPLPLEQILWTSLSSKWSSSCSLPRRRSCGGNRRWTQRHREAIALFSRWIGSRELCQIRVVCMLIGSWSWTRSKLRVTVVPERTSTDRIEARVWWRVRTGACLSLIHIQSNAQASVADATLRACFSGISHCCWELRREKLVHRANMC